jgi:hypothetical protein
MVKMQKIFHLLLGPELFWCVLYLFLLLIIRLSHAPTSTMDAYWINVSYLYPLLFVPLSFGFYFISGVPKDYLMLRIWVSSIVAGHLLLNKALETHSVQGPGVGTAYIMGMLFAFIVLVIISIVIAFKTF